jgi:hypothetical protein
VTLDIGNQALAERYANLVLALVAVLIVGFTAANA